jgi:TonB family protein
MMRVLHLGLLLAVLGIAGDSPVRWLSGPMPRAPGPLVVGWLQESAELTVDAAGGVAHVTLLEGESPKSSLVPFAGWRFRPAIVNDRPVASRVFVTTIMRPPILDDGPTAGTPPRALAAASGEVPYPVSSPRPQYPPRANADAVVLIELSVGPDGRVLNASPVVSVAGFDEAALTAARTWSFRPAQRDGHPIAAFAYVIFGFRRPL